MSKIIILLFSLVSFTVFCSENENQRHVEMDTLYAQKKFNELDKIAKIILKKDEKDLDALFFLVALRRAQGKFKESLPYQLKFEQYHDEIEAKKSKETGSRFEFIDAWHVDLYYYIGIEYFKTKKFNKALKWLLLSKSSYYRDWIFNFYMGMTYLELKDYKNARKHFNLELEQNPNEPSPYFNIACTYAWEKNSKDAIVFLKKAIDKHVQFKREASLDECFNNIRTLDEFQKLVKIK